MTDRFKNALDDLNDKTAKGFDLDLISRWVWINIGAIKDALQIAVDVNDVAWVCEELCNARVENYEAMSKEELIECLKGHDAHHQEHHDKEKTLATEAEQLRKERDELTAFIRQKHDVLEVPIEIFNLCIQNR